MAAINQNERISAFWFAASDRLPHGDGRPIVIGEAHSVQGDIVLCSNALHASRDAFDALQYASGPYLYQVQCWGDIVEENDKLGARYREYIAMRDASNMLRQYAREQALSVIHLQEALEIVKRYLETGNETIRTVGAARAATWTVGAAGAAAWATAKTRFNELVAALFAEPPK